MSAVVDRIDVRTVEGPVALCDDEGVFVWTSNETRELLGRAGVAAIARIDPPTWRTLEGVGAGQPCEWRAVGMHGAIEVSRFRAGAGIWLVIVRDLSMRQASLAKQLHRQRLEVTGRLVASIAHELRNSVASIVYSADLLQLHDSLSKSDLDESVREIMEASRRLRATVDGLLDYARLGPSVSVPVSLREVLTRAQGFLGPYYRGGAHRLRVTIPPEAEWVQGNSIVVEQIFVNLLLNAAEASEQPITVLVLAEPVGDMVRVRVKDDGPGVEALVRDRLFEPFVTGREHGTGLGLANTREAVESLGGRICLEDDEPGATFAVHLPRSHGP